MRCPAGWTPNSSQRECIDEAAAPHDDDREAALFGTGLGTVEEAPAAAVPPEPHRFFPDVYAFAKQAISPVLEAEGHRIDDQARMLRLTPPADLCRRQRRQLPAEVLRETDDYVLSTHHGLVE